MKPQVVNDFIGFVLAYVLIGLSVFWGTMLFFGSVMKFVEDPRSATDLFLIIFAAMGAMAWVNAGYVVKRLNKERPIDLLRKLTHGREVLLSFSVLVTIMLIGLFASNTGIGLIKESAFVSVQIALLPWLLGEIIMTYVQIATLNLAPAAQPLNEFGVLVSLWFELIFFYFVGRTLSWRPFIKR